MTFDLKCKAILCTCSINSVVTGGLVYKLYEESVNVFMWSTIYMYCTMYKVIDGATMVSLIVNEIVRVPIKFDFDLIACACMGVQEYHQLY